MTSAVGVIVTSSGYPMLISVLCTEHRIIMKEIIERVRE